MKLDPVEQRLGYQWFFAAGSFSLLLIYFLVTVDNRLTHSDAEAKASATMHEVRLAQTSLGSFVTDHRQTQEGVVADRPVADAAPVDSVESHH